MILAILQARTSSTRLPGKVLKTICGKSLLELQIERVQRSSKIDRVVVATSVDSSDDAIAELCFKLNIPCFRGSLNDVLDRFYQAAVAYMPSDVVRLTGDCPLSDPEVIDQVIDCYTRGSFDYVSNTLEPTFPDGLDVEVCSFASLRQAWLEAKLLSEREHVTPFIHSNRKRFKVHSFKAEENLSTLRWTVDEPEDFELVKRIYEALYPGNQEFSTNDILSLLAECPELKQLNTSFQRNEGFQKSLREDQNIAKRSIGKSLAMQERAKQRIPGMTQLLSKRPDQFSLGVWPGYYSKANGINVWDLDGNRYTDMSNSGIGANVLGYCDAEVNAAVSACIQAGNSCSLNCAEEVELADLLCEIHPWAEKVRFARTGGESMAIAVRIARAFTNRDKIAFSGYHGWHDWYLAANLGTKDALGEHLLPGLDPRGVPSCLQGTALPFRYNQLDELKTIVSQNKGELAAIVIEPVRNDLPTKEFLEGVRAIADETGAVLIVDEVSAAFRMNSGGSHLLFGLTPDIAVFSKSLGNGYPIGAIIGKSAIMAVAQDTFISSTYWTERIGPVAAIAMIKKHRRVNAGEHLMRLGRKIQAGWMESAKRHYIKIHVGGIPPLSHFSFDSEQHSAMKAFFVQSMLEKNYLASTICYTMYAHTEPDVDNYLTAVNEVFLQLAEALRQGNLLSLLKGKPSVAGFKRLT